MGMAIHTTGAGIPVLATAATRECGLFHAGAAAVTGAGAGVDRVVPETLWAAVTAVHGGGGGRAPTWRSTLPAGGALHNFKRTRSTSFSDNH